MKINFTWVFLALSIAFCKIVSAQPIIFTKKHPKLLVNSEGIEKAKQWIKKYKWYRELYLKRKRELDEFISRSIYVSPLKQKLSVPWILLEV